MLSLEDGFEDASSKPLDVVSVADGDAEECVQEILVEILKLKFGEILNRIFCQDIEAEEELNPPLCLWRCLLFTLVGSFENSTFTKGNFQLTVEIHSLKCSKRLWLISQGLQSFKPFNFCPKAN